MAPLMRGRRREGGRRTLGRSERADARASPPQGRNRRPSQARRDTIPASRCTLDARSIYLSIYPFIYLSIYLSIYPSIHLSIHLSICLSIVFSYRSVDGGIKMVARGLKKGAESVKGGVVHAFEGGHDREEPPRGADAAALNKATRTAGGSGGGGEGAREAVAALHERGEKLETLKSKVDGLAAESEAFAASAYRLNK